MGKRGPAPKPRHLKVLAGTERKDRGAENPVEMEAGMPERPKFADPIAEEWWDRLAPRLLRMGVLTEGDGEALAKLCDYEARYQRAQHAIAESDRLTFTTASGYDGQIPEISIADKAFDRALKLYSRFGMTPADRSQVERVEPTASGKDRFFG